MLPGGHKEIIIRDLNRERFKTDSRARLSLKRPGKVSFSSSDLHKVGVKTQIMKASNSFTAVL